MIPKTKHGNCDFCPKTNTAVIKRGREYYCIYCAKTQKAKQYMETAKAKIAAQTKGSAPKSEDKDKGALWEWFKLKRTEMKGKCAHCGEKSEKHNDKYFHYSIAHILPKAYFPSVATHVDNWLELCHFGNSCHTNMDNKMLDLMDLNCFDEVVEKFINIYPSIARAERKRIPEVLLQYLDT